MSRGLYHCSRCKQHFYDHEATAMHIKDKHGGKGKVLRHPTKKELLIREQQHLALIRELDAAVDWQRGRAEAAKAKLDEQVEWVKRLADDLISAEKREARIKAERDAAVAAAYEDAAQLLEECSIDGSAFLQTSPEWIGSRDALERVRREARNEALEEAIAVARQYLEDEAICMTEDEDELEEMKGRLLAWIPAIRAMMEDDDE